MPGGDRMGPMGMGPRTGRGAGFCGGYPAAGYANAARGGGWGRGGGGRGGGGWRHRNCYHATGLTGWQRAAGWAGAVASPPPVVPWAPASPPAPEQERAALQQQAEWLEHWLAALRRRIEELRPDPEAKPAE